MERDPRRLSFRFLLSNLPNPFPAATPLHFGDIAYAGGLSDPVAAVVFCAPTGACHTVVGGRVIVEDGEIVTLDMAPVIREHNRNATRLAALHV